MVERLPVTVVEARGRLDLDTAGQLRDALIKCLVDCPEAVVVDLSALDVETDLPLSVFRVVRRHAAIWPAIPVLLAAPSFALAERLDRTGLSRALPMYAGVGEAVSGAAGPPTLARADWDLLSGPVAPGEARTLVADVCAAWGIGRILDRALIVVSELVTNAVVHATGPVHLTALLRPERLHLVVRDRSPVPPRRVVPAVRAAGGVSLATNGRGLPLLDAVCRSWGHLSSDAGKAVWAMVTLT